MYSLSRDINFVFVFILLATSQNHYTTDAFKRGFNRQVTQILTKLNIKKSVKCAVDGKITDIKDNKNDIILKCKIHVYYCDATSAQKNRKLSSHFLGFVCCDDTVYMTEQQELISVLPHTSGF